MRSLPHIQWCAANPGKDFWSDSAHERRKVVPPTRPASVARTLRLGPRARGCSSDSAHDRKVVPPTRPASVARTLRLSYRQQRCAPRSSRSMSIARTLRLVPRASQGGTLRLGPRAKGCSSDSPHELCKDPPTRPTTARLFLRFGPRAL